MAACVRAAEVWIDLKALAVAAMIVRWGFGGDEGVTSTGVGEGTTGASATVGGGLIGTAVSVTLAWQHEATMRAKDRAIADPDDREDLLVGGILLSAP